MVLDWLAYRKLRGKPPYPPKPEKRYRYQAEFTCPEGHEWTEGYDHSPPKRSRCPECGEKSV